MIPFPEIVWYKNSPDGGDPECLCSLCAKQIGENEQPIRLFGKDIEARFHDFCFAEAMRLGLVALS